MCLDKYCDQCKYQNSRAPCYYQKDCDTDWELCTSPTATPIHFEAREVTHCAFCKSKDFVQTAGQYPVPDGDGMITAQYRCNECECEFGECEFLDSLDGIGWIIIKVKGNRTIQLPPPSGPLPPGVD